MRSVLALSFLALTPLLAAAGLDAARLAMEAFGPVRIGMTVAEARRASPVELVGAPPSDECGFLRVATDPGIQFMIERGKVSRIDIIDAHHSTLSGIGIGDTEARAQTVYGGKLEVRPHKYDRNGHYLILKSWDRKSALVLETDGTRITRMRAGLVPSVEYVEGCS